MPQAESSTFPDVVESYRDFVPPPNFRRRVENLLKCVPAKYLVGLKTILLTNHAGLTRDLRKRKIWSRGQKKPLTDAWGSYWAASRASEAAVWLYVDNISAGEPSWWRWFPVLCYMKTSDVLYHEIGHHISKVHRPEHADRENVAEDWSRKLWSQFVRKHYWYLFPLLYVTALLLSPIAKLAKSHKRKA
jgi:hypothetical protein